MDTTNPKMKADQETALAEFEYFDSVVKEHAPRQLYIFNKYVLNAEEGSEDFIPMAPIHKEICQFIDDRKDLKKLMLIPRGHLKTKLVTVGYSTQKIVQNPAIRILIYSATYQVAVDILSAIKHNLQSSEVLINLWGDLSTGALEWSEERIRLKDSNKREPTVTAAGIDNNLVGGHYDLIIFDDVVNQDNVFTMDQIEKVKNRYRAALDLLEPSGEIILIGTRWHDADLYGWILDTPDIRPGYRVMVKTAYDGSLTEGDDFIPLWPGKFTREDLLKRLQNQGWSHFSSQYMNNPIPEEDATFKRGWFRYYDSDHLRGMSLTKFISVDPAISQKKTGDYTGIIVAGVDVENNIYVIDVVRRRMSPNDIINELFRLREMYEIVDVGIELVAYQQALAYALREDPRFKRNPFHIQELKPMERSKDQRIKGLQPLYENGKIYHNKLLPNNIYLEDELVRFPRSTHDDLIDPLAYLLDFIFPTRQKAQRRYSTRYLY